MTKRILVYGIGNPGRQDDALGILLVDKLESWLKAEALNNVQTDQNYQLNIEDADRIAAFDTVVFADASVADIDSVLLEKVKPDFRADFSMHSVEPPYIVGLCQQMFDRRPECYQLHIKGYAFRFMDPVTEKAKENLEKAFQELTGFIERQRRDFDH